jgi:hypothetical protein
LLEKIINPSVAFKRIYTRCMCLLTVFVFVASLMLVQSSETKRIVKADTLTSIGQAILHFIDSTGADIAISFAPAEVLTVGGVAVMAGMGFNNAVQIPAFCQGFYQWYESTHVGLAFATLFNVAVVAGTTKVTETVAGLTAEKQYISGLTAGTIASTTTGNVLVDTFTIPPNSSAATISSPIDNLTLSKNSTYIVSIQNVVGAFQTTMAPSGGMLVGALIATYTGLGSYYQNSGGMAVVDGVSNAAGHDPVGNHSFSDFYAYRMVTTATSIVASFMKYDSTGLAPSNVWLDGGTTTPTSWPAVVPVMGEVSNTGSGATIRLNTQNPAVSLDTPVSVSVPTTGAIPTSAVVGQTAASIPAAIAGTASGVIANDVAGNPTAPVDTTPDWSLPKTGGIDLSPLELALSDRFPFCIPFDLVGGIQQLVGVGSAPSVTVSNSIFAPPHSGISGSTKLLDFSSFQTFVNILRWFIGLAWVYFLILKTRDLVRG